VNFVGGDSDRHWCRSTTHQCIDRRPQLIRSGAFSVDLHHPERLTPPPKQVPLFLAPNWPCISSRNGGHVEPGIQRTVRTGIIVSTMRVISLSYRLNRGKRAGSRRDIHHGCRSSSSRRPTPDLRVVGNVASTSIVIASKYSSRTPSDRQFICSYINIQSLGKKVDHLLDVRCSEFVDVLFVTESWHDSDSVFIHRLRAC